MRDICLAKPPKDYDIITSELPPFPPKAVLGKDIKTYRYLIQGVTVDVSFELNLDKRDFPINAIALDFDGNVKDPRMGMEDLFMKRITLTKERLQEDPVRIFRCAKLCAELNFAPEGEKIDPSLLETVSEGRLFQEYLKLILSPNWIKAVEVLTDFFALPLKLPQRHLPPIVEVRTAACQSYLNPRLFGLPSSLVKTAEELSNMELSNPALALCSHGKKAVRAALVQNDDEVISLYKQWALFRHRQTKVLQNNRKHEDYITQCISFINEHKS